MFQAPKNSKSEFSQLPSFGQIANTPLQTGNPSSSPSSNLSSTSPFTTMATFPGTSSQMESSSFRNPSAFSTSSFIPKSGSVLFSNQTKSTTSVGVSQPSNLFASATTTNPLAGIFSTGTTHPTSHSSSPASSSSFTSSTSSGNYTTPFTPSNAFGNSSRTENISSLPNNFGGGASSSPRSKSVFGHSSTAPSVKSNLFVPSTIGLFAPTNDGTNTQTQAPFTMNQFETSSKGLVFSSQLTHPKSAVPVPGWGSPPSKQLQTNPFIGTKSNSVGVSSTGHTSSVNTVPSSHLFQSSTTAFFQPNTVSPVFIKNSFVSSSSNNSTTATSNSLVSGNFKAFSTTGNSLQKSAPVTSSAFSQNSSIGQTVSKVFGSSSEGSFSATSLVKNTKVDNVGLFGKPIESKSNLTKTSSSSSSEIPKVLSTSSYEVGLFGKPEKKIEQASEASIMPVSQPAKVGLFGKQLVPKESETNERTTRKRSVSPKRPWSKPSHSGRHEMESEEGTSSSARASKITPFGRLYSEMDSELKPASSRLFKKNETDNTNDNSLLRRRTLWNKPKTAGDKTSGTVFCF